MQSRDFTKSNAGVKRQNLSELCVKLGMEELDGFNEHYFGVQQMFLDNVKSISSQFAVRGKYLRPYSAGFRQQLQVMLDRHGKDWWGPEQMRDRGQLVMILSHVFDRVAEEHNGAKPWVGHLYVSPQDSRRYGHDCHSSLSAMVEKHYNSSSSLHNPQTFSRKPSQLEKRVVCIASINVPFYGKPISEGASRTIKAVRCPNVAQASADESITSRPGVRWVWIMEHDDGQHFWLLKPSFDGHSYKVWLGPDTKPEESYSASWFSSAPWKVDDDNDDDISQSHVYQHESDIRETESEFGEALDRSSPADDPNFGTSNPTTPVTVSSSDNIHGGSLEHPLMGEDTTPLARPHNPLDEGTPVQFLRHGSDFSPNDGQSDNHVDHLVQADGDLVPHRVKLSGSGQLYFQQEVSYRGKPHTICGWLDLNPSGQSGPDIEDSSIEFSIAGHDQISVLGRGCNGQAIKDIDFLQPFPDSSSAQDKGDKQSLVDQIDFRQPWYDLQRHKNKPRGQGNQASSSLGQRTGEASNKRKCLHENQSAHRTPSHREQAQRQVLPAIETGEDRKIIDLNPVDQLYDDKNERELDAQPSLSRLNLERARPAPRYAIEIGDSSK